MGQAKARGTYKERKQAAIENKTNTWKRLHPREAALVESKEKGVEILINDD